ncbi:Scr1 family TA system antitoxin-like transcriptional regulator [Kitasatospora sp. NPDC001159]
MRLARQEILTRWPLPVVTWVIDESVLRRPLGGWDVHKDQLQHLLKVGQMRGLNSRSCRSIGCATREWGARSSCSHLATGGRRLGTWRCST